MILYIHTLSITLFLKAYSLLLFYTYIDAYVYTQKHAPVFIHTYVLVLNKFIIAYIYDQTSITLTRIIAISLPKWIWIDKYIIHLLSTKYFDVFNSRLFSLFLKIVGHQSPLNAQKMYIQIELVQF